MLDTRFSHWTFRFMNSFLRFCQDQKSDLVVQSELDPLGHVSYTISTVRFLTFHNSYKRFEEKTVA